LPGLSPRSALSAAASLEIPTFTHLVQASGAMFFRWRVHPHSHPEYLSPAIERITGRRAEDFYGNPGLIFELIVESDRPAWQRLLADPSDRPRSVAVRWKHASGAIVWTDVLCVPVRNAAGTIIAVEGLVRDVSREKEIERERDAHAAMLMALIANLQDGVMAEDQDGRITVANAAFCRMFSLPGVASVIGRSAHDLREHLWRRLVPDVDRYRRLTADLKMRSEPQIGFEIALTDGRVLDRDYVPVPGPDGTLVHMWHYRDVTERRRIEGRLRETKRRLRELSAHSEGTREEERRQLARTLHDELGQLFSSIRLELVAAIARFRETSAVETTSVVDRLQAAAGLIDLGIASLRTLTTSLRPPVLDHLGLVAAIRWEASLFSKRTGIRCHVRASPPGIEIHEAHVTALYRILLAALDNIVKHAAAGTAWISLARKGGTIVMEIRDNGRGITEEEIDNPDTMGLLAMRERALVLGGEIRISGARARGTRIRVILPDLDTGRPPRVRRAAATAKTHG
jgi:PAS domain S-box-containing protein